MDTTNSTLSSESSVFNSLIVYNNAYDNSISSRLSVDLSLLDSIAGTTLFDNFLKFEKELKTKGNYITMAMDNSYDFRPDKLAQEIYKNQSYYPAILVCNNVCSLLQFRPALLNFSVKIPTPEVLNYIISKL